MSPTSTDSSSLGTNVCILKRTSTFVGTYIISFCLCLTSLRSKDVGRPKADVAAEFINQRVPGCNVVPYPLK